MRNATESVLHDPGAGVYVVIHVPSAIRFIVEGHDPMPYLRDCIFLHDHPGFGKEGSNEGDRLSGLIYIKLETRYKFSEFTIRPYCVSQISKLIEYITKDTHLETPKIVMAETLFKHIYGIKEEISIRDLEYGHYM